MPPPLFLQAWWRCSTGCVKSLIFLPRGHSWSMPSAGTLVGWSQTIWTPWKSSNDTFLVGTHQISNQSQRRYEWYTSMYIVPTCSLIPRLLQWGAWEWGYTTVYIQHWIGVIVCGVHCSCTPLWTQTARVLGWSRQASQPKRHHGTGRFTIGQYFLIACLSCQLQLVVHEWNTAF